MKSQEFWAIREYSNGHLVYPVYAEMSAPRHFLKTDGAAREAVKELNARSSRMWSDMKYPKLHPIPTAPSKFKKMHLSNNLGAVTVLPVLAVSEKAMNINDQWIPRKAMYSSGGVVFLRRWFIDKATKEVKKQLKIV